ncbi:MAG TPA: DPP IV N-terminal domain-containing protein [Phycisphaerales bacterium]|nr:DPP IV N-terminal domain-containing protein [Phycisphaerales bacterium]
MTRRRAPRVSPGCWRSVAAGGLAVLAVVPVLTVTALTAPARAQAEPPPAVVASAPRAGAPENVADPDFLRRYAETFRFTLGQPRGIRLTPGGEAVLFLRSGPRSFVQDLYELDVATGQERVLLTAGDLLGGGEERLTPEELARRERMRLASRGIVSFSLSEDGTQLLVPLSGRLFVVERSTGARRELVSHRGFPIDPSLSPDGSMVAAVREGEVYVTDLRSGREWAVTSGSTVGSGGTISNGLAEFIAQEEMGRFHGYWWSPDSRKMCFQQTDTAGLEVFHIADPVNPDKEPQSWPYPRPGKANARVRLAVVDLAGGGTDSDVPAPEPVWVRWDDQGYPYLAKVDWQEGGPLTLLVQNREQTEQVLLAVDDRTGETSPLVRERDEAWLNIQDTVPKWLKDGSGFLWITEANGAPELELRGRDGKLVRSLTGPRPGLYGLAHLEETGRFAHVSLTADPTQRHVWRVPVRSEDGAPAAITHGEGHHSVVFAEKGPARVWAHTPRDGDPEWTVFPGGEGEPRQIRSVAERPGFRPKLELTTVGSAGFHAALIRPRNFEEGRRYPVIASVYAGPGSQTVNAVGRGYLLHQWMADHGFIVLLLDGRGTPGRGHDWERAVKGNLINVPLEDQVAGLRALGDKYPELDLERVGVYGWSFGGYFSAMAAMRRPDVYRAGVAGAPVCDWLDYDTHYTERYMGLPEANPDGYMASSVLTYCPQLIVPLMIIHGTADDNVYFMHSLKMTGELFRAGRRFEFLPLAGLTHMVPDPLVTERLYGRIMEFFERSLAAEPMGGGAERAGGSGGR